ncbi:MAG: hypothetical protein Q8P31_04055 [Bacillota bacterium]|nr:hypothetical protein [Bacillota bacterium]
MSGIQRSPGITDHDLTRFIAHLRLGRGTRVDGARLWQALAEVYPHRPAGPAERQLLSAVLHAAAEAGALRLPPAAGRRWDRSLNPPVPTSVDLIAAKGLGKDSFDRHTYPWHQALAWVPELPRLTERQLGFLRRVHEGLVNGWFREPAPLKYRSLQLTGDEKDLADLVSSSLFGPGRLTLETLNCRPEVLPLAWEPVGEDGGRAVVFENAGPFAVARRVLTELGLHERPYDLVVYGGGRSVLASLGHLLTIGRPIESLHYVGDLDEAGLEIAAAARGAARDLGLPELRPAEELHLAMLRAAAELRHAGGWPAGEGRTVAGGRAEEQATGLSPDVRPQVVSLLSKGMRIPEEVLGPGEMRRAWRAAEVQNL